MTSYFDKQQHWTRLSDGTPSKRRFMSGRWHNVTIFVTEASSHHALVQCPMMQRQESFPQTGPHTPLLAKKFANVSTLTNAPGVMSVHLPMYVSTQAKGAPRRYELQRVHTLTHSHLEKEPHGFRYKFSRTNSPLRSETPSQRPQLELRNKSSEES